MEKIYEKLHKDFEQICKAPLEGHLQKQGVHEGVIMMAGVPANAAAVFSPFVNSTSKKISVVAETRNDVTFNSDFPVALLRYIAANRDEADEVRNVFLRLLNVFAGDAIQ
mmetsp:Transcript_92046/g.143539  ORF Transcript_92046/g.143539 Transcript_92046/m.143539 type:complete len:110 (+) Transcript_92046:1003-1332(+)